jgi:hypothetical protein
VKLEGSLMHNIQFEKSDFKDVAKQIQMTDNVDKKVLKIK